MAMCPLAVDWGNIADWAAVAVGTLAACGTIWVALLAHATSRRAAEIAEEATKIAQQQHAEAVSLRKETARILGRVLMFEISDLPARLGKLVRSWEAAIEWENPNGFGIKNELAFERTLIGAAEPLTPSAERVEERIHNLPDSVGADLATLIGGARSLNDLAKRMKAKSQIIHRQPDEGGTVIGYGGNSSEFEALRHQLRWMFDISVQFAHEFQDFSGIDRLDYKDLLLDVPTE